LCAAIASLIATLLFVLLAALLQVILSAAWILALIPVPVFRRYLSLVLQKMTLIIGDSYGLVANDTQRAAILSRFRSTVDWLQSHCEKVIIIAHSQGSAVVSEAIKDGIIPHPPLLLTFGSGSTKLSQLRLCELAHSGRLTAAAWIVPALIAGTLLWAFFGQTVNGLFFSIFGLYAVSVGCAVAAWAAWSKTRQYPHPPGPLKGDEQHRWIDLYATNDPVPQGALTEHFPDCGITSERIVNRRSALTDHTTYWSNKTEFVSRVATELCEEAGLKGMPVLSSEHYRWARGHHRVTIAALVTAFWTIAASIFLVALLRFKDLSDLGRQMFAAIQSGPFTSIVTYLQAAAKASRWILLETSGAVPLWHDDAVYASLAILVLLLIAYLWWHIVVTLLVKWDGALVDDFLTQSNNWGKYGAYFVWPFIFLFLLTPLALSYAPSLGGGALLLIRAVAILLALLFLFAIVASVYTSMPKNRLQFKEAYSSVLTALKEATLPGSDDPSSERRGWNSWKNLFECCVFVIMVGGPFGVAAEKLFGVQNAIDWLIVAMYGTASILMLVRLGRLALRRTGATLLALGIAAMPVVIGMVSSWGLRTDSSRWISIGVLIAAAIPFTYFIVDRSRRKKINVTRQDV